MSDVNSIMKVIDLLKEESIEAIEERIEYFESVLEAYKQLLKLKTLLENKPKSIVIPSRFKEFTNQNNKSESPIPFDPKPIERNGDTLLTRIKDCLKQYPQGLRSIEITKKINAHSGSVAACLSMYKHKIFHNENHLWSLKSDS